MEGMGLDKINEKHKFVYGLVVDNKNKIERLRRETSYTLDLVGILVFDLYKQDRIFIRLSDITQYDVATIANLNHIPLGDYKGTCKVPAYTGLMELRFGSNFLDINNSLLLYYSDYIDDLSKFTKSSDFDFIFKTIDIEGFDREKLYNSICISGVNSNFSAGTTGLNDVFIYNPIKNKIKRYVKKLSSDGSVYFQNLDTGKVIKEAKFIDKYFIINCNISKCKLYEDYSIRNSACDTSSCKAYMKFGDKCVISLDGDIDTGIVSLPLDCKVVENLTCNIFSRHRDRLINIVIPPKIEKIRLENLKSNNILYIPEKIDLGVARDFVEYSLGEVDVEQYSDKLNSNNLSDILDILSDKMNIVVY